MHKNSNSCVVNTNGLMKSRNTYAKKYLRVNMAIVTIRARVNLKFFAWNIVKTQNLIRLKLD